MKKAWKTPRIYKAASNMRKPVHDELIASLLGDVQASPSLQHWTSTDEGRRGLSEFQEVLDSLDSLYRRVSVPEERPPVYYAGMEGPIGDIWMAVTDKGLMRVSFAQDETSFITEIHERTRAEVLPSSEKLGRIVAELREYFSGTRSRFDFDIDLSLVTPFQRRVLQAAAGIPIGQVITYGELAGRIGQPQACRAVGQALGRNPIPVVIPCHRIVGGGGGIGGYTGGLHIKRKLLELEGVAID
jgi:methylated-DNA-[protein]-cysteine S-methyltransferase